MAKFKKPGNRDFADNKQFEDLKEYSEIFGSDKQYGGWKPSESIPSKHILIPGGDFQPVSTRDFSRKQREELEMRLLHKVFLANQKKAASEKKFSIKVKAQEVTERLHKQQIGNTKKKAADLSRLEATYSEKLEEKNVSKPKRNTEFKVEDRLLQLDLAKKLKLQKEVQENQRVIKNQSSPQISAYARKIKRDIDVADRLYLFKDLYAKKKEKISKLYDNFSFSPKIFSTFASSNEKTRPSGNATPQIEKSFSYKSIQLHTEHVCNSHDKCKESSNFTYYPATNRKSCSTANHTQRDLKKRRGESSGQIEDMRLWKEMREKQLNSLLKSNRFDYYSQYDTETYKTIEPSQTKKKIEIPYGMYLKDNKLFLTR